MLSQQLEDGVGKRDLAVPAALAADAEDAASTVDIGNLEVGALHEAQATAVDRGQADAIDVDADGVEDAPDLLAAEDHGERLGVAGLGDIQTLPLAAECLVVEESEAAEDDREGAAGDLLIDGQVQKVAADFVFFELLRGPVIMAGQLSDGMDVALNRARGVAPQLHLLDHLLA